MLIPHGGAKGPMPKLAGMLADGLRGAGCEVATEPWGGRGKAGSVGGRALERLGDVLRIRRAALAEKPDVVLIQTSHDWMCVTRDLMLTAALRGGGRKIVLEFHGSHADRLVTPGYRLFKFATALLLRLSDGVFVLSSYEQHALQTFFPGGGFYLVTNPFIPPAEATGSSESPIDQAVPVVLFAARLLTEKGIFDTLEAFAIVNKRVPSHLVVAGDGPAADALKGQVRQRGLAEQVTLTGHLSSERLLEAYRRADVFVLPTYHPEGFPTSISEAMGAGLPIVTTRVRGIADHLSEETNALFVPPHDPAALALALERVLTDSALREQMSKANREKVKDFAPDRVAGDYVRALEEIASR